MALQVLFKQREIFGYIDGAAIPSGKILQALQRFRFDPQKIFNFVRKLGRMGCFQTNGQSGIACFLQIGFKTRSAYGAMLLQNDMVALINTLDCPAGFFVRDAHGKNAAALFYDTKGLD